MTPWDVRPAAATFRSGDDVELLVDSDVGGCVEAVVTHVGTEVRRVPAQVGPSRTRVALGRFPEGSYAVRLTCPGSPDVTTAFDVLADPMSRPRYGFVTDFAPDRDDLEGVTDSLRAFHLNAVQFYDWMFRHACLLPPSDRFTDSLGRDLSLDTVRALVAAVHDAGAHAIGYAAVYGAGREYADAHPEEVLRHRGGAPWQLGDLLAVMDISRGSVWARHVVAQMREAVEKVGFDGLHLDQYGDPKLAVTAQGAVVDLADGFVALIEALREQLPAATLVFNNVGDFPTSVTVRAPLDVTYVEVWAPNDTYADLVRLVDTARDLSRRRPVVLAAYLEPLASAGGEAELAAAKLALSTVWACGGHYLLFGERHGVLTDPYYPRHATLGDDAVATLRAFADFAVANGDVLVDPSYARSTRTLWQGVNDDLVVDGVRASPEPEPGAVWVRVTRHGRRLVVQLIDLSGQEDGRWNAAKRPTSVRRGVRLTVRVVSPQPVVRFGHPLGGPDLVALDPVDRGEYLEVRVPEFDTWALLVVDC